jgi:hypothetical protein
VSERTKPHRLGRSVGAVVAGFVATALLSLGTDVVMVPDNPRRYRAAILVVTALPCVRAGGVLVGASGKTEVAGFTGRVDGPRPATEDAPGHRHPHRSEASQGQASWPGE